MKLLYKGMKKVKFFLGSEKLISKGMKLLYKSMKKVKFFLWSEKVVSQGMKLLYQGMKKFKFFLWSEKVPFGYEKKPVFENFPFHTLGYENFGCFFLMTGRRGRKKRHDVECCERRASPSAPPSALQSPRLPAWHILPASPPRAPKTPTGRPRLPPLMCSVSARTCRPPPTSLPPSSPPPAVATAPPRFSSSLSRACPLALLALYVPSHASTATRGVR
jgi:hypothetical protein